MDSFEMMVRQVMLYSLPLLITLTTVAAIEHYFLRRSERVRFHLFWQGAWLPFMVSILFGRAMIVALPCPQGTGLYAALIRFTAHGCLCILGFLLYTWALQHPPLTGLPPLHHWWSKVLMYLNLCLLVLHVLPLPSMVVGELILLLKPLRPFASWFRSQHLFLLLPVIFLMLTPLMDKLLGGFIVFPIYEILASLAG